MDDRHFLKQIFIEKNFNTEELENILSKYQRIEFAKNEYLIKENTVANYYYFLESGYAQVKNMRSKEQMEQ